MDNAVLDVALGLLLFFGVLSLLVTIGVQLVGEMSRLRGKTLRAGVQGLIDDPALHTAFYEHGLIAGAMAAAGGRHPGFLSPQSVALALIGCLNGNRAMPEGAGLEKTLRQMPDSAIRDVLLAQLAASRGDVGQLQARLAGWFEDGMHALSPVFAGRMRLLSLVVATIVVVAANADSLALTRALWSDRGLREQITQAAAHNFVPGQAPRPAAGAARPVYAGSTLSYLKGMDQDIRPLPLGWGTAAARPAGEEPWLFWGGKAAGWLISILAAAFGAGALFDLAARRGRQRKAAATATQAAASQSVSG